MLPVVPAPCSSLRASRAGLLDTRMNSNIFHEISLHLLIPGCILQLSVCDRSWHQGVTRRIAHHMYGAIHQVPCRSVQAQFGVYANILPPMKFIARHHFLSSDRACWHLTDVAHASRCRAAVAVYHLVTDSDAVIGSAKIYSSIVLDMFGLLSTYCSQP